MLSHPRITEMKADILLVVRLTGTISAYVSSNDNSTLTAASPETEKKNKSRKVCWRISYVTTDNLHIINKKEIQHYMKVTYILKVNMYKFKETMINIM